MGESNGRIHLKKRGFDKMEVNHKSLAEANKRLKHAGINTILKWTFDKFGDDVSLTTAFGYSGLALLHHVLKIKPDIPLYFIDTGFHFKETMEFTNRITKEWNLRLKVFKPEISKRKLKRKIGEEPYRVNPDLCCHYCKVEPLLQFLHDKTVWLSGIRREQSATRAKIEPIEMDGRGVVKISPMYNWTQQQTWDYIIKNNIPYNPLHDKGYASIGCEPCTRPIKKGEKERDGRWPFMQKLECGIHLNNNGMDD
jgi:phosphoadenosine phosphosulfate reductase